jgi:GNAT superfamily N-acetyltransferase
MAEPIEFFIEPESMNNVDQQAYLDYRDRLAMMKEKDRSNPKKMAGMKKAVIGKFDLEPDEMEGILDEYNPKKIDPSDPKTWMKFDDGRVDIGGDLLVKDSVALGRETDIYRRQAQALGNETLGVIEGQVSSYPTRVLGQAGIDTSKTPVNNPAYRDNYNRTMSSIYQDVIDGIDPMDSLDNHLDKLGLPNEFGNHLFLQTESVDKMMRSGADVSEAIPYPRVTQDVIDSLTDQPVYHTADDALKPIISYSKNPGYNPDMIVGGAEHRVQALHAQTNEVMGQMTWWGQDNPVPGEIDKIDVEERFRRQGVATQMLEEARRVSGVDGNVPYPVHSTTRTAEGEAWAKSTGDKLPPRNPGSLALDPPSRLRGTLAGAITINADGTETVAKPQPLNPITKPDDLVKRATSAATGSAPASGSSASMTSSVASTVSSGGAARVPAAVASTSPPVASAAARTAAAVTAPTAARSTRSLMSNALEVGQKVTRGHLGATALGVAAAGLLFGYANRDDD